MITSALLGIIKIFTSQSQINQPLDTGAEPNEDRVIEASLPPPYSVSLFNQFISSESCLTFLQNQVPLHNTKYLSGI